MNLNANSDCDNGSSCSGTDPLHTVGLGWRLSSAVVVSCGVFSVPAAAAGGSVPQVQCQYLKVPTMCFGCTLPFVRTARHSWVCRPKSTEGMMPGVAFGFGGHWGFHCVSVWHGTASRNSHGPKQSKVKIIILFFFSSRLEAENLLRS